MAYNVIQTSAKFAIDLDASSGPWSLIHSNLIRYNSYQAVFIEQGTQFSIVSGNTLPGNQNGVSFFNNVYPQLVINHVILNNVVSLSTAAGQNLGSISCQVLSEPLCPTIVGFWPTADSYLIGNIQYNNKNSGYGSNGANQGSFVSHNLDYKDAALPAAWAGSGLANSIFKVVPSGVPGVPGAPQTTGYFPDPFKRQTLVPGTGVFDIGVSAAKASGAELTKLFCDNCANLTIAVIGTSATVKVVGGAAAKKVDPPVAFATNNKALDCHDINTVSGCDSLYHILI